MATPASFHHPASPQPAIPGAAAAAVAACAAMAVSYVAVLYAPTALLRLPPPTSLHVFLHRRFLCAAFSSSASLLATASLLRVWSIGDSSVVLAVFGIRRDHLLQAVAIPLLLTSLVYAGSFVARLWLLANSCGGGYEEPEIGWAQRLAHRIRASVGDVMVWRNCVVAPITEELVFRACMVPLLLCGGFKIYNIIFLSPVFFSLGVQLGYTVIFGWYAVFLFTRTGNIVSPIVAHIFCNIMGLPVFSSPQKRGVASVAFLAGSLSFFWLLFPATSPKLYNSRIDQCSCWHGYCRWS
uniref:intramembrane prenyl-peptidase Rce1 n=1 Tax=Oryza rufipogon TaxID=4529 RepID=A0A0E0PL97_ORYRU